MSKERFFEKALHWTESQGFTDIKANVDEFETPASFSKDGEDLPYIPDITGKKWGSKSYIEIAEKSDNVRRKVSKWKLLGTVASMKKGKLFLLAPRGHKAFTEKVVAKHNIPAEIVSI